MSANDNMGNLVDESLKRKERLKLLREKAKKTDKSEEQSTNKLPKPLFRSYKPLNENTGEVLVQEATGGIEAQVASQLQLRNETILEELDIGNLAPRKPDWDLKRDVSKKLEHLERRTQKAIAELIRERLKNNQDQNISQAVNVGTSNLISNK